jgi:FkbM family methyltransferase
VYKQIRKLLPANFSSWSWEKHKLSDWYHTYISTKVNEYYTLFGYKLKTRNYIANKLMVNSSFEMTEMSILKNLIEESDVFIDIGANIGYYTCMACSLSKMVLAFEPQQQNIACLLDNVLINNWTQLIEIYPIGLGKQPDILTLYGASGPSASLLNGWAGYSNKFRKLIPVNSLDNILSDRFSNKKITIKIDVEGAEYDVLKGALSTLRRTYKPSWFLEICLDQFHPNGFNPYFEETFNIFFENGYEAHVADATKKIVTVQDIRTWAKNKSTGSAEFNYYFVPMK